MRLSAWRDPLRLWHDADKRRALLLSLTVHLGAVLTVATLYRAPEFVPQPGYFVIEVGPPGGAAEALPSQDADALEDSEADAPAPPTGAEEAQAAEETQESEHVQQAEEGLPSEEAAPPPRVTAPTPQPAAEVAAPEAAGSQETVAADSTADSVAASGEDVAAPLEPSVPAPAAPEAAVPEGTVPEVEVLEPLPEMVAAPLPARVVEAAPPSPEALVEPVTEAVAQQPAEVLSEPLPEPLPEMVAEAALPVTALPAPRPLEVALPGVEVTLASPLQVTPEVAVQVLRARPVELPLPELELAQPRDVSPEVAVAVAAPPEAEPVAVALPQPELEEAPAELLAAEPEPVGETEAVGAEPEPPDAELALEPEPAGEAAELLAPEPLAAPEALEPETLEPETAAEALERADAAPADVPQPDVPQADVPQADVLPADVPQPAEVAPQVETAPAQTAPSEAITLGRADAPLTAETAEGAPAEGAPAEGAPAEGAPAEGAPAEGASAEVVEEASDPPPVAAPLSAAPPLVELAPEPESGDSWTLRPSPVAPPVSGEMAEEASAPAGEAPTEPGGLIVRELPQDPAAEPTAVPEAALPEAAAPFGATALPAPEAAPAPELPPAAEQAPPAEQTEAQGLPGSAALEPYEDQRRRAIVAILDNADRSAGRQSGLREASLIYEMPVEGNLTRLMAVFDRADPSRLGPIRSARDYQHAVVEDVGGALVHVGGSPAALNAIARGRAPSFDALQGRFGELYSRTGDAPAPYNLYSDGLRLRDFLGVYATDTVQRLRGTVYRPAPELPEGDTVEVRYPGGYSSGFRFVRELNLYQWQRSGAAALDASGESVVVQAVVVAQVAGAPLPGDPEGRLYLALDQGGAATLYLGGKVIEGRWQQRGGFRFVADDGHSVDLTPFKTWVAMVPSWAQVALP